MKNKVYKAVREVIMDTYDTEFKCNNIHFENYELNFTELMIPYIQGQGGMKNEIKKINENKLIKDLFKLASRFQDEEFVELIQASFNFFKEIDKVRTLRINNFNTLKETTMNQLTHMYFKNKYGNDPKKIQEYNLYYTSFLVESMEFFNHFGIPKNMQFEDGYNLLDFALKLNECYTFFKKIESLSDLEKNYKTLVVDSAKFEVKKNKDGFLTTSPFFDDPFEFVKFKLLISTIRDRRGVRSCLHCNSLFIARRKNQLYCSPSCKARYHERKIETKNKKRKKE